MQLLIVILISFYLSMDCMLYSSGNYVLNYLATQSKLENFVIQALVQLFARITKQGWFDSTKEEFVFRNVITDINQFINVRLPLFLVKYVVTLLNNVLISLSKCSA